MTKETNKQTPSTYDSTATEVNKPIPLKYPYKTAAGAPINQVTVQPITVRVMKQAQRRGGTDEAEVETAMVAMACELVPEDLDDMHVIDYQAVRARFQKLNFGSAK